MEHKKTFGMFILQRRRELGMTQKEFASLLFVTESAVSKWERGLSYPDITLLQSICSILEVSEHELLSGSEDTQQRNSDRLAERYIRLCRNTRLSQYIFYGGVLLLCAIINLSISRRLNWFFIVLPAVLMCASITLVPSLCAMDGRKEPYRHAISLGGFTLSLELLLLAACQYSGGSWFGWAGIAALFAISLAALPFLLPLLPLPEKYSRCRLSIYLAAESLLLLLLLLVCSIYTGGSWFPITAVSVIFGLNFFFLPVFLRQLPLPAALLGRRFSLYIGIQTGLLLLLLLVSCLYTGGSWFLLAAVSVIFGLGLVFLPPVLRQLRLPGKWGNNLLLLYFSLESLLLFLVVILANASSVTGFSPAMCLTDVLACLVLLSLPWGIMLSLRYIPAGWHFRAAAACGFSSLWLWVWPLLFDAAMSPLYGWRDGTNYYTLATPFSSIGLNPGWAWYSAAIAGLAAAAALLLLAGRRRKS